MTDKSVFLSAAEQMKDKLGHAMCLAKWQQVSLHLSTGHTNSCYHPPLHEIDPQPLIFNPGALHNTEHKKAQRKLMLEQQRPQECNYCWTAEEHGPLSDRHYRSAEPWAAEHYDEIINKPWDADVIPTYVEINFSNACNMACAYCSPQFSSTWQVQVEKYGAYPTKVPHNDPLYFQGRRKPIPNKDHNPYVEAFWKWWPELYSTAKHIRLTGGEPTMDKNTHKILDYVLALPKSDLHLSVTSNFRSDAEVFDKYFAKVKKICEDGNIEHFMQYVSTDSGNDEMDHYIRRGPDSPQTMQLFRRVHRYLRNIPVRNSLTFIITMSNLNLLGLKSQLSWILGLREKYSTTYQRVWFDVPLLQSPTWMSMQILPESYYSVLEEVIAYMKENQIDETSENKFVGFKDYEIQKMERNLEWMKVGRELSKTYIENTRADFYRFFNEYDKRHDTNFMEVFPEMKEFFKECRWLAESNK